MKNLILHSILMTVFLTITIAASAQKGAHHHPKAHRNHPQKRAVVYHSKHRPATIVVYHPHWAPKKRLSQKMGVFSGKQNLLGQLATSLLLSQWKEMDFCKNFTFTSRTFETRK